MRTTNSRALQSRTVRRPSPGRGLSTLLAINLLFVIAGSPGAQAAALDPPSVSAAEPQGRGGEPTPWERPLAASPPSVSLSVPGEALLGSDVSFTVAFENNDPVNVGYGPILDVILDTTGADGDDGLGTSSISASYAGLPFTIAVPNPTMWIRTFDALGQATHPLFRDLNGAYITVNGTPGDTLVVLRLPFGSFAPGQPPATVAMAVNMSTFADVGTPLSIQARGGYEFGYTPLDDWCCEDAAWPDAVNPSWTTRSVTPTLLTISKSYLLGPEDETATGPNFPRQYTVTLGIAPGQSVRNLVLNDVIPDNMQFASPVTSSPAGATCTSPGPGPGGSLSCSWPTPVANGVSVTFSFHIPLENAGGSRVINRVSGDDVTSCNQANAGGNWEPSDPRDRAGGPFPVSTDPAGCEHTLTDKSIAIQKSGPGSGAPGATIAYDLSFQISDFFGFDGIEITDVISDGQHLDAGYTPQLEAAGNGFVLLPPFDMAAANYDVVCNYTGGPGAECTANDTAANDGTTALTFRVSNELISRGQPAPGRLVGGCVNPAGGTADPDCGVYDDGPTTAVLRFQTTILDNFTDSHLVPPNSGDPSVDQGDVLDNRVSITGFVLDTDSLARTDSTEEADLSTAGLSIGLGDLSKRVYALNGEAPGSPVEVKPGDELTYRITYTLPTSDEENLEFRDYLPLPVFHVGDPDDDGTDGPDWTFDPSKSTEVSDVPDPGGVMLGPSDTFYQYTCDSAGSPATGTPAGCLPPALSSDSANNLLAMYYGDFNDTRHQATTVDLLFTVTVSDDPFADRLFLTNQAQATEGSTNAGTVTSEEIVQIVLTQPVLVSTKGVIWTSDSNDVFDPDPPGPVSFLPPANAPRWAVRINSTNLAATPIDSNVRGVDAGDTVSFAIVIENTGSSLNGAFDIVLRDDLPDQYQIPAGGPNLQIYYGDSTRPAIPYAYPTGGPACTGIWPGDPCGPDGWAGTADDLFGYGIQLVDPVGKGVCDAHNPNLGNNIILVTFDLQLRDDVTPGDVLNTSELVGYAGSEGGPNHLATPQTDTAQATIEASAAKTLVGTEIDNTVNSSTQAVIAELVTYRLSLTVPEGVTPDAQVIDSMDAGLAFVQVDSVTLSTGLTAENAVGTGTAPANVTIGGNGSVITFNLGDVTNADRDNTVPETIEIVYAAVVLNAAGNQSGRLLNNSVVFSWDGGSLAAVSAPDVTAIEPVVAVDKLVSVNGSVPASTAGGDADDTVDYTITLRHDPSSATDAFDVVLEDRLPRQTPVGPSYIVGPIAWAVSDTAGLVTAANFQLTGSDAAGYTLSTVTPFDMALIPPAGPSPRVVTVTVSGRLSFSVQPGPLPNTATGQWTSFSGPPGQRSVHNAASTERTGADGPGAGLNNYADTGVATINIIAAPTKSIVATSEAHTGFDGTRERLAIGEIVRYRMSVGFPEGTSPNFQLADQLPQGLLLIDNGQVRVSFTADNDVTEPVDLSGADNDAVPPTFVVPAGSIATLMAGNRQTVTFTLGDLVNNDSDVGAETITLEFNALVDDSAAGSNDAGDDRDNNFTVWVAGAQVGSASNTVNTRIAEPSIAALIKSIFASAFDGGDTATYRLSFANGSGANVTAAFDVVLTETVPVYTTFAGPSGPGAWSCALGAPAGTVCTYAAGNLAPGASDQVDFRVTIVDNVPIGITIPNSATVTYTSLPGTNGTPGNPTGSTTPGTPGASDGERDGSGVPTLNDYRATGAVDLNLGDPLLSKTISATSVDSTASGEFNIGIVDLVIGEEVTFEITATLPEGAAVPLRLTDNLPTVPGGVLSVVNASIASIGSQISTSIIPTVTPSDGSDPDAFNDRVVFDFGNVTNAPDGVVDMRDRITVQVVARVENVAENQNGDRLTNSATLAYNAETVNATADIEIVEPLLTITKTASDDTPALGQTITYTLTLSHAPASTADAQDVIVTDRVPNNLSYVATTATAPAGWTADATGAPTLVFRGSLTHAGSVSFTYQAALGVPPAVLVGQTFTNTAVATWTSIPGVNGNERTGTVPVVQPNDYTTSASETVTASEIDLTLTKDDGGITAAPGQTYAYSLTIRNIGNVDATGVTVTDTVPLYTAFTLLGSSPGWSCLPNNNAGSVCTINVGNLAAGGTVPLTFRVTVNSALPVLVLETSNTARVDGLNEPVLLQGNNSDTEITPLDAAPDLTIDKDDGLTVVAPGTPLAYILTFDNVGDQDATGVTITDVVPLYTTFSPAGSTLGWSCVPDNNPLSVCTFTVGDLDVGAGPLIVTFAVDIDSSIPVGVNLISNTASIADEGTNGGDQTPADNRDDDVDNLVTLPNTDLTKTLFNTSQLHTGGLNAAIGEILTYRLEVTVPAGGTMNSATLTDTLDPGLALVDCVAISGPGLTFTAACNPPTNPTVGPVPPGDPALENQGRRIVFDLGNVSNPGLTNATLTIDYTVVVLDSAANMRGATMANAVVLEWTGGTLTETSPDVILVEPTLTLTKAAAPTSGPPGTPITFTLTIGQVAASDSAAFDLLLEDVVPVGLTYVPGSLTVVGGPPNTPDETGAPTLLVRWDGFGLGETATVQFQARLGNLGAGNGVTNTARLEWTSLPDNPPASLNLSSYNTLATERRYDPANGVDLYGVAASATVTVPRLPDTGFAPDRITPLHGPNHLMDLGDLRLEIPALGIGIPITGVPAGPEGWDLTWLAGQAGYLEGTAYPTHAGNSALTAHVTLPNGKPGPFARLGDLRWGDRVIVRAYGQEYVYEVRTVARVNAGDLRSLGHKEQPWLTLITCRTYDEAAGRYVHRLVVQAVLITVIDE